MNERTLHTLEFPKILRRLAQYTFFSASQALALRLRPSSDREWVNQRLQETTEARQLLAHQPNASVGATRDVREAVGRAEKGGMLEPAELLDIVATLASGRSLRNTVSRIAKSLPRLARLANQISDCPNLERAVKRTIGQRGEVLDSATPELQRIRSELRVAHDRLVHRLEALVDSAEFRPKVQESVVTVRSGRYVIPVKSEFRGEVPGIVHDQSASGATVFVEPMQTVDLNNRWRQLQLEERDEVERILQDLAVEVAAVADKLRRNVEALADLDLALAKARYSHAIGGVESRLVEPGGSNPSLHLIDARHPLLVGEVVPITVWLGGDFSILVITGPNTGGKTVALKTAGLLAMMAQAGMHIPAAEGSRLPVFQGVYADIGDEQSIEQSLSTFSAHMTNIIELLGHAGRGSLVLLDELGAGTDPAEGSALARAILVRLLAQGPLAMVATHYPELKAFAQTTPGVQNACVEFDSETLAPTYRLSIGLPGRSNALAIAARLGLPPEILADARSLLAPDHARAEALLAELEAERDKAAAEHRQAQVLREEAEQIRDRLRAEWASLEDEREHLRSEARGEAQQEVQEARERLRRALAAAESAERAAILQAAAEVRAVQQELERPLPRVVSQRVGPSLQAGDRVLVKSLHQQGKLLSLSDEGEAEVQLGGFRLRVPLRDLEEGVGGAPEPGFVLSRPAEVRDVPPELEVRGWRAEEVPPALEQYLNDAYLAGLPRVRIIHGKGTGTLRQVVRERLAEHPLVRSFHTPDPREGGEGVTVAVLAN